MGTKGAGASGSSVDTETALLAAVFEFTLLVAQAGVKHQPPVAAPEPLRPFLKFKHNVPTAALRASRVVLDTEPDFRERLVPAVTEELVGVAGVLYVTRPSGWREQLDLLVREEHALAAHLAGNKSDRAAGRKAEGIQKALDKSEAGLLKAKADLDVAVKSLAEERRARSTLQTELDGVRADRAKVHADNERITAERDRALASLRDAQREIKQLRNDVVEAQTHRRTSDEFAMAVDQAVTAVQSVHAALLVLRTESRDRDLPAASVQKSETTLKAASGKGSKTKAPRRRPTPLPPGVLEESTEAATALLREPMMLALVDGYNVAKLRWPDAPPMELRDRLMNASTQLAARTGAAIHLVFDGEASRSSSIPRRGSGVRVTFAPGTTEADDVILSILDDAPITAPIVVVSNDRRVIDGALARGANVLRSPHYIAAWSRLT